MKVSIIGSREVVFKGKVAKKVILPAFDGEVSIFDFHETMLVRLKKGRIVMDDSWFLNIKDGVARIKSNELVVMIER